MRSLKCASSSTSRGKSSGAAAAEPAQINSTAPRSFQRIHLMIAPRGASEITAPIWESRKLFATPDSCYATALEEIGKMIGNKLYPEVRALLEANEAEGAPAIETLSPADARQAATATLKAAGGQPEEVGRVENLRIPHPERPIPIRIFTPAAEGPFPCLVYFHGCLLYTSRCV